MSKTLTDKHPKLKPFLHFGLEIDSPRVDGNEVRAFCFACGNQTKGAKSRGGQRLPKLFLNVETGQYNCKHCSASGNVYSFLAHVYKNAFDATTPDDLNTLASLREGITPSFFATEKLALLNGKTWLIPIYNRQNSLISLRTWDADKGGPTMACPGLPLSLGRLEKLNANGPIYICEGEWDAYAMENLRVNAGAKGSVLFTPGASVFKQDWLTYFLNREVVLCFDHDNAGYDNAKKHAFSLQGKAQSVKMLHWPSSCDDGYDVRDFVIESKKTKTKAKTAWESLHTMMYAPTLKGHGAPADSSPEKSEGVKPAYNVVRTKFEEIIKDFKKYYHVTPESIDALAIIFAITFSSQLSGDPLWLFIVAPPGTGKTLFLRSLEASPYAIFRSSITSKSLVSGYMSNEDPSLIPQLTGKTLVLKDFTEVLSMNQQEQEEIYAILRGAYDGRCEKSFGSGLYRCYEECYFAMLAGVTDEIHTSNRSALGERFLKYQMIDGCNYDPATHIRAAIQGLANQAEAEKFLSAAVQSFTDRQIDTSDLPTVPDAIITKIVHFSQVLAYLRTTVKRTYSGDIVQRPAPEVGSRLGKQLTKLCICLSLVYGHKTTKQDTYRIVEKIGFDTVRGWNLDIARLLATPKKVKPVRKPKVDSLSPEKAEKVAANFDPAYNYTIAEISELADIPRSTLSRRLEDMELLGIVTRIPITNGETSSRGNPPYGYQLNEDFFALWIAAGLDKSA